MAIKTFINGQENGVITFKGDTEPCAVYVNGERQDNISYIPTNATGESSVEYKSEYKKNLRTLQIDGNTVQEEYGNYNIYDMSKITGASAWNGDTISSTYGTAYDTDTGFELKASMGVWKMGIRWLGATIPIKQGGTYYVSCKAWIDNTVISNVLDCAFVNNKLTTLPNWVAAEVEKGTWASAKFAITVPVDWVGDTVYLSLQGLGGEGTNENIGVYIREIMITYENDTDVYEEYRGGTNAPSIEYPSLIENAGYKGLTVTVSGTEGEPTTAEIPQYTRLENSANDTILELARLGDYADKLVIDRTKGTVKYIQQICVIRPFASVGGTLSYMSTTSISAVWKFSLNKTANTEADELTKCEFGKVYVGDDILWLDAYTLGISLGNKDYFNIYFPKSLGITSFEALDSYLMQNTGYFGFKIQYVLETPVEWDLLNSDLEDVRNIGQALLEWAKAPTNQTNIIEITSTPSVSKLSVNYAKWGGG